jgi:hypothetical protein
VAKGKWPKSARELDILVLSGVGFNDTIDPVASAQIYSSLTMVPKGKVKLTMEVTVLQRFYKRTGPRSKITKAN